MLESGLLHDSEFSVLSAIQYSRSVE